MKSQHSTGESSTWKHFQSLARRLSSVPKSEVDKLRAKEAEAKRKRGNDGQQ